MPRPMTITSSCPFFKVGFVDVCDLELTARARFERFRDVHDLVIVEVQSGHGISGFRLLRFFFDAQGTPSIIKFNHSVTFRIVDGICGRLALHGSALPPSRKSFAKSWP